MMSILNIIVLFCLMSLLTCNPVADQRSSSTIDIIILANNHNHTFHRDDIDDTSGPFNVSLRGMRLNFTHFEQTLRFGSIKQRSIIDLGDILYGQKLDICVYFQIDDMPACGIILIKPLPIRDPVCASTIDSIQYGFTPPKYPKYDHIIVKLMFKNSTVLERRLARDATEVTFNGLESGAEVTISAVTHAGQQDLNNSKVSDAIVCHTLDNTVYADSTTTVNPNDMSLAITGAYLAIALCSIIIMVCLIMIIYLFFNNSEIGRSLVDKLKMMFRQRLPVQDQPESAIMLEQAQSNNVDDQQ